jgi:antitoxin VapB
VEGIARQVAQARAGVVEDARAVRGRDGRRTRRADGDCLAATGYPGEWQRHHQGGPAGYEAREYIATPDSPEVVAAVQPFAWNPSVPSAKSEDTFLISEAGAELLTPTPGWPQVQVALNGATMERPDILRLDLQ